MIEQILRTCLHRRLLVIIVALLLGGFGYYAWARLTVEAYPAIGDVAVQVITQVPGLASEEVEQQITIPLERALAGTPGLKNMRSSSTFALSNITLVFRDGAEDYWSRQRVTERISQVELPPGIQPGLDPVTGPTDEIYRYTLESESKNLMELSEIQRWQVIPALKQVSGVADVANFGGFTVQYQLELDPMQLQRLGIGLNDVVNAINNNSSNAGGSRISRGEQSYVIRGIGMVRNLSDVGNIVVTQSRGVPVLVRDLGKLAYSHQEREGILGKDSNPDTLEGIVLMLKHENPSEVLKGVHAAVNQLSKKLAPQGVRIVPCIDRDDLVQLTVHKVTYTILEGIALVFLVLVVFLRNPRIALVAGVAIPFALVTALIVMHWTNMSANLFSMAAVDYGIIVDGAIVVVEAALRRREANPTAVITEDTLFSTTTQVARPIFFGTLIIMTAYLPLFAFEHAEAKLFLPIAYTMGLQLLGALLCTFILVPGLALLALRKPRPVFHNRPLERLQAAFRNSLDRMLSRPGLAYLIAGAALAGVVGLGATTGRDYLPDLDEGNLWLQVQLPSGLSLEKASEMAGKVRQAVREFPEVSYVMTQLGRSDEGNDPFTPSHLEAPVGLRPYNTWPKGETREDLVRRLAARLRQVPGISVGITQPIIDMVWDVLGGAHSPLVIRIVGDDFKELRRIGGDIVRVLDNIRGTSAASIYQEPPIPQIALDIDRSAAARYGINVSDITSLIQTGVGGAPVGTVYVGDRTYGITVRFPKEYRNSPDALGSLVLTTPGGSQSPPSQVAKIRVQTGEATVSHEMGRRALLIRIENQGRALSEYMDEAKVQIARQVHFDHDKYHLEWGGQFESQRRAQARLIVILGLVLALMVVFLFSNFGKMRQALLVLGTVPLATLGGLIALHLTGESLNVASAIGFIALFGVAVQNGIIMVSNINRVRDEGLSLRDAVLSGAVERFRPVLMTATVASVGMLPAALATGVGTDVQRNLATVVVGGLMIATLLTLFILPTLYFAVERWAEARATSTGCEQVEHA